MKDVLVIGGGFAGVWSAAGAIRAVKAAGDAGEEVRVTLVSGGDDLVIRPRLYEDDPETMRVPLDRVLGPIGVRRLSATVTGIDTEAHRVQAVARDGSALTLPYDKLVLAAGSRLVRPSFPGAEHMFDIDTLPSATALDHHLRRLPQWRPAAGRWTAVIVGAGFTGLEIATVLGERMRAIAEEHGEAGQVRVLLVDRSEVLGPELGEGPRPVLDQAIDELKIERRLGRTVSSATREDVTLSDGETVPAATVIWTAGMMASPLTAQIPGERDRLGRLSVDGLMRVPGVPDVYAAGDTAVAAVEDGRHTIQSCQHAQPMGKCAGYNAAAELLGAAPLPFAFDPYSNALDLGSAGAVLTDGWERRVTTTGPAAKEMKQNINTRWIYPSLDDPEEILAQASRLLNSEHAAAVMAARP
ncbi:NAD(P)/FAD-dependent oxidoreductase [Nonomuraea rubra]|uniref:NAD(P)/FAD-dependent oxidoreductase n=1 Tax=Nonomuraea rubra TaxID=46180 RepID=UPI0033E10BC2